MPGGPRRSSRAATGKQYVRVLGALDDTAYGTGLLNAREREAERLVQQRLGGSTKQPHREFVAHLKDAERVVEWARGTHGSRSARCGSRGACSSPRPTASVTTCCAAHRCSATQTSRAVSTITPSGKARVRHDLFGARGRRGRARAESGLGPRTIAVAPTARHGSCARTGSAALRDARGARAGGRHRHPGRGQRALARPAPRTGRSASRTSSSSRPPSATSPTTAQTVLFIATPGGRVS